MNLRVSVYGREKGTTPSLACAKRSAGSTLAILSMDDCAQLQLHERARAAHDRARAGADILKLPDYCMLLWPAFLLQASQIGTEL